jgi:hypothetical protein
MSVYFIVMAGQKREARLRLDAPAIHVFDCNVLSEVKIWIPGAKATAI